MMNNNDVLNQIEKIRRQLWLGHASLMVGSGFSRNADKATPITPTPPDWIELGDKLIDVLYPHIEKKERSKIHASKNVLRLAEEFDIECQRPALNALLQESIQDDNLLPSDLHVKMLELPWADVFTTNYDTLLERAARQVTNIKYDVVLDCKDLPYSESPRIIKLHGSFPSEATHLIVSEEDYRTYPNLYAPFVNTVQQAIMETTLCLVGFSGSDPNFLKWIGWVKDNLHKSMPPIYLIGVLELSSSDRKVLEKKSIIPVDLSCLPGVEAGNCAKALGRFFELLNERPCYYNWTMPDFVKTAFYKEDLKEETVIDVIQEWKKTRESYPNWIVLPWEIRSSMVRYTESWSRSIDYLKSLPNKYDIEGLYELTWRLEKCLIPIFNNLIQDYEEIIDKYDPFGLENKKNIDSQLQKKWLYLCFSLLRWSREELDEERWNKYEDRIKKVINDDVYSLNQLYYEQAFRAIALPNLELLDSIVAEWKEIKHPLIWKVKMASFLSLIGENENAVSFMVRGFE